MSPEAWSALSALVTRLGYLAEQAGSAVDASLARRIELLDRATFDRQTAGFSFALGATGSVPPAAVEAWTYGGTSPSALPEVAVWLLVDAACKLAATDDPAVLRAVVPALDAWAEALRSTSAAGRHARPPASE